MRILCILLYWLAVSLTLIELSSESQPPAEQSSRLRSRSPTLRETFPGVLGFRFEDLALIRLRPYNSPNRVFDLRKYVFPPDKPVRLRKSNLGQRAMPTGEQIVLSTSDGDVCALLDKASHRITILRAICTLAPGRRNRAKINMNSGEVKEMTEDEMAECPVSTHEPVPKNYAVLRLGSPSSIPPPSTDSCPTLAGTPLGDRSESLTLRETFRNLLGYGFDDLASIRLNPYNNQNQILKLGIYAFPMDKQIGLRTRNCIINPLPPGEQIVLVTSNDDICAILRKPSQRMTAVRPILTSILGNVERVKMNMNSGEVEVMTTGEIAGCPGSAGEPIKNVYRVFRV